MTDPQFRRPWEVDPEVVEAQRRANAARELERARRGLLTIAARGITVEELIAIVDVTALPEIASAVMKIQRDRSECALSNAGMAERAGDPDFGKGDSE